MAKRKGKPKLANSSPNDVFRALKKLGAFEISEGGRHTKIIHTKSGMGSTIPRHNPINKNLLKSFVKEYLIKELNYLEEEIYKYLWC